MHREPAPGSFVGHWRILRKLGHGGMGVVYAAEDASGRQAALKLVLLHDATHLARFEREARAAQAVKHENVAESFELFAANGLPVLVMELLPGGSLRDRIARGAIPWPEAAALGAQVARGLSAVHVRGLVHRDLKPENILLDRNGVPKITDFGLVRRSPGLAQSQQLTKTGDFLGTFAYMAPEQADGARDVDFRADLYSLGIVLHELLAGERPFAGDGITLIRKHLTEKPPSLRGRVPARLDAIVQGLLAKDVKDRPESAADVARDLEALLASKEEPPRGRGALVAGGVLVALAALAGAGALVVLHRAPPPPPPPPPASTPTPPTPPRVLSAEEQFASRARATLRRTALTNLEAVSGHDEMRHAGAVRMVAFARDAKGASLLVSGGMDGAVKLWDPKTGELVRTFSLPHGVRSLAVTPDGRRLAASTIEGLVAVFDLRTGHELGRNDGERGHTCVAISDDGEWVAASGSTQRVHRFAASGAGEVLEASLPSPAWCLRFKPHETTKLVAGLDSGQLAVCDLDASVVALDVHQGALTEGLFSPDGAFLSVGRDQRLVRTAFDGGGAEARVHERTHEVYGIDRSPNGRLLVTGGHDGRVELHDPATLAPRGSFPACAGAVLSVAFDVDSARIATGGEDGTVRLFDLAGRELHAPRVESHRGRIDGLALSPDGARLATTSEDGTLKLWDADSLAKPATRLETHGDAIPRDVCFAGDRLVTVASDGHARLWDASATTLVQDVTTGSGAATAVFASPDGARVLVENGWWAPPHIFAVESGLREMSANDFPTSYRAAFAAKKVRLALGHAGRDGKVDVFDVVARKKTTLEAKLRPDSIHGLAFLDPDGRRLVAATVAGGVTAWDSSTRRALWEYDAAATVSELAVLDARVAVLAGSKVLLLGAEHGTLVDTIDLAPLDDLPLRVVADPKRHALWLGTGRGAILRFHVGSGG